MSLILALKAFFSILFKGKLSENLLVELKLKPSTEPLPAEEHTRLLKRAEEQAEEIGRQRVIQLLAILQRDARLIDFICEDIRPYSDAQVGAAVRTLHEGCRKILEKYVLLEPVMSADEGSSVEITAEADPSTIKLIGNVSGRPPMKGVLRHKGWRVVKIDLPALPQSGDKSIVAAAEVEV
ncbi:MAG: DUF2760 domain-containing protein [Acidobacteriota bacterium]|nr:DUF2760 domain-containing protein [Blastocatellia bacterium]MDW8412681.1 DUF2760 domain-containing protein [Acidobacteriota bacterium]